MKFKTLTCSLLISLTVFLSNTSKSQCTFGNFPSTYTMVSNFGKDFLLGVKFTLASSATLTGLGYKGNGTGSGMQMAIYSDAGGVVGNLVAVTNLTTNAAGNITIPVTTPTLIPAGDYWVMGIYQVANQNQVCFTTSAPTNTVSYIALPYGTPPPNTATWLTYTGQDLNYWAVISGTAPAVSINSSSNPVCSGSSVTLTANGAGAYNWSTGSTSSSIVVSPTVSTSYTVTGVSGACFGTSVESITVNPLPVVTVSGPGSAVCTGSTACLSAFGGITYSWTGPCGFSSNVQNPCFPFYTFCGCVYSVTVANSFGCVNTATYCIATNPNPTVSVVTSNSIICTGQTSTLTANGALTYSWSTSTSGSTTAVSPTINTTYSVTGTDANGCYNTTSFTQSVSTCAGINELASEGYIIVFPNPSNGEFTIRFERNTLNYIEIYNSLGDKIREEIANNTEAKLKLTDQPAGIYFVKIAQGNRVIYYGKIVKE